MNRTRSETRSASIAMAQARMTTEERAAKGRKISAAKMGHSVTQETRAKLSRAASVLLLGRPVAPETRKKIALAQEQEKAHHWKGEAVGYQGAHKRHRASLPYICAHCGATEGRLDVALRHDTPLDRLLGSVKFKRYFSVDPTDYVRLCRSCHIQYDRDGHHALAGS